MMLTEQQVVLDLDTPICENLKDGQTVKLVDQGTFYSRQKAISVFDLILICIFFSSLFSLIITIMSAVTIDRQFLKAIRKDKKSKEVLKVRLQFQFEEEDSI